MTFQAMGYEAAHVRRGPVERRRHPQQGRPRRRRRPASTTATRTTPRPGSCGRPAAACASPTSTCPTGGASSDDHYQYKLRWLERLRARIDSTLDPVGPVRRSAATSTSRPTTATSTTRPSSSAPPTPASPSASRAGRARGLGPGRRVPPALRRAGGLFSWWDYRAGNFHKGKGMRIDLVLATEALADRLDARCSSTATPARARARPTTRRSSSTSNPTRRDRRGRPAREAGNHGDEPKPGIRLAGRSPRPARWAPRAAGIAVVGPTPSSSARSCRPLAGDPDVAAHDADGRDAPPGRLDAHHHRAPRRHRRADRGHHRRGRRAGPGRAGRSTGCRRARATRASPRRPTPAATRTPSFEHSPFIGRANPLVAADPPAGDRRRWCTAGSVFGVGLRGPAGLRPRRLRRRARSTRCSAPPSRCRARRA